MALAGAVVLPDGTAEGGRPAIEGPALESLARSYPVSYTHLRAHETVLDLVCRLLLEQKNQSKTIPHYMHQ